MTQERVLETSIAWNFSVVFSTRAHCPLWVYAPEVSASRVATCEVGMLLAVHRPMTLVRRTSPPLLASIALSPVSAQDFRGPHCSRVFYHRFALGASDLVSPMEALLRVNGTNMGRIRAMRQGGTRSSDSRTWSICGGRGERVLGAFPSTRTPAYCAVHGCMPHLI
jgi:hypothetical protein